MKKLFIVSAVCASFFALPVAAYQLQSNKELGAGDAKNQNVVVVCTTTTGKVSTQTCSLRRYAKCTTTSTGAKACNGWGQWQDVRTPGRGYNDWRSAASACCQAKGLR